MHISNVISIDFPEERSLREDGRRPDGHLSREREPVEEQAHHTAGAG